MPYLFSYNSLSGLFGSACLYARDGAAFSWVSFVLLIEGGLGLASGGIVASYSPVVSKFGEIVFRSEPWSKTRQKTAEKQGQILIVVGFFLLLTGLLISAAI